MPIDVRLKKTIERALKNNSLSTKLIKKLEAVRGLNTLFNFGQVKLTLLMFFVKTNQLNFVKQLLSGQYSIDPTLVNDEGLNALAIALLCLSADINYDSAIIDELLKIESERQFSITTPNGTLLYLAVLLNLTNLIQCIAKVVPESHFFQDVTLLDSSPLHEAVKNENLIAIESLLAVSPEKQVLQRDKAGISPLHIALSKGNLPITQCLLSVAAIKQLSIKTKDDTTTCDFAFQSENLILIQYLKDHYSNWLLQRSTDDFTCLQSAIKQKKKEVVKLLLASDQIKDFVVTTTKLGFSPLVQAISHRQDDIAKLLLTYRAIDQLALHDSWGNNVLHVCCTFGADKILGLIIEIAQQLHIDLTPYLLEKNYKKATPIAHLMTHIPTTEKLSMLDALLNLDNEQQLETHCLDSQVTPFLIAFENNHLLFIEKLLTRGSKAQLFQKHLDQVYPLEWAVVNGQNELAALLFNQYNAEDWQNIDNTALPCLPTAISLNNKVLMTLFLDSPNLAAFVNAQDTTTGNSALHVAVEKQRYLILQKLLDGNANLEATNLQGWTALHVACKKGHLGAVQLLLKNGANLAALTNNDESTLYMTALSGNLDIAKLIFPLFKHHTIINQTNLKGLTPLFAAAIAGHVETCEWLLENGADPNQLIIINNKPQSLLLYAINTYNLVLIELLVKFKVNLLQKIAVKERDPVTILDIIVQIYSSKPSIYDALRRYILELPSLKIVSESSQRKPLEAVFEKTWTAHQFLNELGYTKAEIKNIKEERKANKQRLKVSTSFFSANKHIPLAVKQPITWLSGTFASTSSELFEIASPQAITLYGYVDAITLNKQHCDASKLTKRRFKFDGNHFKKLEPSKGVYTELLQLKTDASPINVTYTYELKINQVDRVLFFPLLADDGKTTLFVGTRYLSGGLHSQAQITSLTDSLQASSGTLCVNWPTNLIDQTPSVASIDQFDTPTTFKL